MKKERGAIQAKLVGRKEPARLVQSLVREDEFVANRSRPQPALMQQREIPLDGVNVVVAAEAAGVGPVPRCRVHTGPSLRRAAEFAQHIGMCKRSVENMVTEGLPIVGKGRRRRVPVAEAVAWVRAGGAGAEIEKRARFDANRASRTVAARKVQG